MILSTALVAQSRPPHADRGPRRIVRVLFFLAVSCAGAQRLPWLSGITASAAQAVASKDARSDLDVARALFRGGEYTACARRAARKIDEGIATESWRYLKIQAELAVGAYEDALESFEAALRRYGSSLRLRLIGREVYRFNNAPDKAEALFHSIEMLARRNPWNYTDRESRVTLGRVLLERGADARQVLELVYDRLKKDYPDYADVYIATGELALRKHDYALASESLERALKIASDDPDTLWKLARSKAPSDMPRAFELINAALELNPNHIGCLLLQVDQMIDSEAYEPAAEVIQRILAINPHRPEAWAYRAVLAHLRGDEERERECRQTALASWSTNPEVDHLIGRKLSQKYRFREGAAYQRRSLEFDADYLPAKLQLCQDLLRLGDEEEGWKLAGEVHDQDGYNVVAYNLSTLLEHVETLRTLTTDGLIVRMEANEAQIYGQRVLELLGRARAHLLAKYEVELEDPVIVEIFPEQKDFAIRTFGLPGGAGFLGVCFGRVITANSPASQTENPSNWEAVLWHEYCHVVTLNKTRNKMPRWLSEGISVYEERQADSTWGQVMTPQYREMVLSGELTPIRELSGAFLSPPSPLHLQFAYYESSLVVEHFVDRYGIDALKHVLTDLADGLQINDALARSSGSIEELEREFAEFARARAEALAPEADWTSPELAGELDAASLADWVEAHPSSIWGLSRYAQRLIEEEQWEKAKAALERLMALYPEATGPGSAPALLAAVHRRLEETESERAVLERLAKLDNDAVDVYLRLMELAAEADDRDALITNAERALAVNPLLAAPHRLLAEAASAAGDATRAIQSYHALLLLDPLVPAELHFRLAAAYDATDDVPSAWRHVLMTLEEAPRYLAAHRLLLELLPRIEDERRLQREAEARPAKTDGTATKEREASPKASTENKEKRF